MKKYIPIVGMFYGIPFIKNPTEPKDFKSMMKYSLEHFLQGFYHFGTVIILNFLIILTYILLTR